MNDYHDAFEQLAERGRPVGATALLERVEHEPAPVADPRAPVRPVRGVLAMAAVFVLVLAVGAALILALRTETEIAGPPIVELYDSHHDEGGPQGPIVAGPGGFLRPAGEGFELSADGVVWESVVVPRSADDPSPIRSASSLAVWASDEAWIIEGVRLGRDRVWVSSDGRNWAPVEWDEPLRSDMDIVIPSGPGFMARTVTAENSPEFWWSVDGLEWVAAPITVEFDRSRFWAPNGSSAGVTFVGTGGDGVVELIHTQDGETWTRSDVDVGADVDAALLPMQIYRLDGRWLVFGREGVGSEVAAHVWTSDDFVDWTYRGTPAFAFDAGETLQFAHLPYADDLAIVGTATTDDESDDVWVSTDGLTWHQVADDLPVVQYLAGRRLDDGTYSIVYAR